MKKYLEGNLTELRNTFGSYCMKNFACISYAMSRDIFDEAVSEIWIDFNRRDRPVKYPKAYLWFSLRKKAMIINKEKEKFVSDDLLGDLEDACYSDEQYAIDDYYAFSFEVIRDNIEMTADDKILLGFLVAGQHEKSFSYLKKLDEVGLIDERRTYNFWKQRKKRLISEIKAFFKENNIRIKY